MAAVGKNKVKVACVQFTATTDCDRNYRICSKLIKKAAKLGLDLICLPECFHFIGDANIKSKDVAEELSKIENTFPSVKKYCKLASELNVGLSLGGFPEKSSTEPGKVFNTHLIITPKGKISSMYRKIHLFDYPQGNLMESSFTSRGQEIIVDNECINGVTLGVSTCYDMRFPSLYQNLVSKGAQILLMPS
jgi:deaminated glutathione amidase